MIECNGIHTEEKFPDKASFREVQSVLETICKQTIGPTASDVDRFARFPHESIAALKRENLLSASVPSRFGGHGFSLSELSRLCEMIGQYCASTAMIFAMHHIEVACISRHSCGSAYFEQYLRDLVKNQYLIASVTSEVGVGGDLRSSIAAVEAEGERFTLKKNATTISYGAEADDLLVTARRSPNSAPGDQVAVLVHKQDYSLEPTSEWDTLGMRGTCSRGFILESRGNVYQILPASFPEIATNTMVPYSHLTWCGAWYGIARGAVAIARSFVRAEARKKPGVVPATAVRLAETLALLQTMQQSVYALCSEYDMVEKAPESPEYLSTIGYSLRMNNLKIACSQMVAQIVTQALHICGISGYKNNSPYSLGRHLRDAHSAALMIGNDRLLATNASLLLVHKDD